MVVSATEVFRTFNTPGQPGSGYFFPPPELIEEWASGLDQIAVSAGAARDAAIDARNTAQGYASSAVSQGNVPVYSSRADAEAFEIPAAINVIRVNGFSSYNDGGAAIYRHAASEPSHPGKFQDANDQWWQLYETTVNPFMFGAVSGASTDCIDELRDCLNYCKAMVDDGRKRMVLDLVGHVWTISDTWSFNDRVDYLTVRNGVIRALDSVAWLDVDTGMNAYYNSYETVTTHGETWSLRKPLLKIAGSNPGLTFDRVDLFGERRAAGILSEDSAQERRFQNGRILECRSYSVHMAGPIDLVDCDIRAATSSTNDRDAYGITIDTSGARVMNVRARWAHCLLLTTGGENIFTGCDFENGEVDATGTLPTILWENRAPDNIFSGGRIRNGQIRSWATRMAIVDANCGNEDEQYWKYFFRFYASSSNTDLSGFTFRPANVPNEMVDGSTYWFNFTTSGQGSWAVDTTTLALQQGYPYFCGGAHRFLVTENGNTVAIFRANTNEVARIKVANSQALDSEAPWFGGDATAGEWGIGNTAVWRYNSGGVLRPKSAGGGQIGSSEYPISGITSQTGLVEASDGRWKEERDFTNLELDAALRITSKAYYRLDDDGNRSSDDCDLHFGVIAQDVAEAFGGEEKALALGVLHKSEEGRLYVRYTELDQIRIQAEARERKRLENTITILMDRIEKLEAAQNA